MDDQLLRNMAWMAYEYNKAIKQIKFDLNTAGWDYVEAIRLSDGFAFVFKRRTDKLQTAVYKADIADAITWDYFDTWWDDMFGKIVKIVHKPKEAE